MSLTTEQKLKYLEAGAGTCPVCSSHEITGGQVQIEGKTAWQDIDCAACKAEWRDVFILTFVETDDDLSNGITIDTTTRFEEYTHGEDYICAKCGHDFSYCNNNNPDDEAPKFCPNCGRKREGA